MLTFWWIIIFFVLAVVLEDDDDDTLFYPFDTLEDNESFLFKLGEDSEEA